MNKLSDESIHERFAYLSMEALDSTIKYLYELLAPYAQVLESAQSVESIIDWINRSFAPNMAQQCITEVVNANISPEEFQAINIAKEAVVNFLTYNIIHSSNWKGKFNHSVTPWDIQSGISHDEELRFLFGIDNNSLPVNVQVGGQIFVHDMTMELAFGLTAFKIIHPQAPYILTDYKDVDINIAVDSNEPYYSVSLVNYPERTVFFTSPQYMQGIITGAQWSGVDHHSYWNSLLYYSSPNTPPMAMSF